MVRIVLIISSDLRRFGQISTIRNVLMVDIASSYSILVIMSSMRRINIMDHVEEYNLDLQR